MRETAKFSTVPLFLSFLSLPNSPLPHFNISLPSMAGFSLPGLSSGNVQLAPVTASLLPLGMTSNSQTSSRPSSSRQARSSRPPPPPGVSHSLPISAINSSEALIRTVPSFQAPSGLSAPSLSTSTIKGHPCVYTEEYQEYYIKQMEELEKGKGKDWSVKKREFKVMREWEVSRSRQSIRNYLS